MGRQSNGKIAQGRSITVEQAAANNEARKRANAGKHAESQRRQQEVMNSIAARFEGAQDAQASLNGGAGVIDGHASAAARFLASQRQPRGRA